MLMITKMRLEKGLSKAKLARRADMVASDVGKIESGRLRPYPSQLRKLARALQVPAEHAETLLKEADSDADGGQAA
jgi:transcriptional regulator with XRE-family HTH domain